MCRLFLHRVCARVGGESLMPMESTRYRFGISFAWPVSFVSQSASICAVGPGSLKSRFCHRFTPCLELKSPGVVSTREEK